MQSPRTEVAADPAEANGRTADTERPAHSPPREESMSPPIFPPSWRARRRRDAPWGSQGYPLMPYLPADRQTFRPRRFGANVVPQDEPDTFVQGSMRQGHDSATTPASETFQYPETPALWLPTPRRLSQASRLNHGSATDQYVSAPYDLPPTYDDAISQSREQVRPELSALAEPQGPGDFVSSQQLPMDGMQQLRQEIVQLRQKLNEEISERYRQISNLKTEQALAIAALKEVTTAQAGTIAALKEVTTEQASLIDELKTRLEDRATGARRP